MRAGTAPRRTLPRYELAPICESPRVVFLRHPALQARLGAHNRSIWPPPPPPTHTARRRGIGDSTGSPSAQRVGVSAATGHPHQAQSAACARSANVHARASVRAAAHIKPNQKVLSSRTAHRGRVGDQQRARVAGHERRAALSAVCARTHSRAFASPPPPHAPQTKASVCRRASGAQSAAAAAPSRRAPRSRVAGTAAAIPPQPCCDQPPPSCKRFKPRSQPHAKNTGPTRLRVARGGCHCQQAAGPARCVRALDVTLLVKCISVILRTAAETSRFGGGEVMTRNTIYYAAAKPLEFPMSATLCTSAPAPDPA